MTLNAFSLQVVREGHDLTGSHVYYENAHSSEMAIDRHTD